MQYDVGSATITVTLFFAVFSAGKTCVYAFLTVYFRHLGISPFQAGILRGIQALISGVSIPSVVYCTGLCAHRRFMMITCIFLTMASYLVLLVMSLPTYSCFTRIPSTCDNFNPNKNLSINRNFTTHIKRSTAYPVLNGTDIFLRNLEDSTTTAYTDRKTVKVQDKGNFTLKSNVEGDQSSPGLIQYPSVDDSEWGRDSTPESFDTIKPAISHRRKSHLPEQVTPMYDDDSYKNYWQNSARIKRDKPETIDTISTESFDSIYNRIWPQTNASCFIMLIVILIIGEMVSSPIDNIASNTWFIYLDEIDYTESHRKHLAYIPITTAVAVFIIGLVNLAQCSSLGIPYTPYHINFYIFGCLLGVALVTTYFFPTPHRKNAPVYYYGHGMDILRYLCTNPASTLLITTVVVNGALYACLHDFVLWYIEDIKGSQFATSLAVAAAFLSDAIGKLVLGRLQRRLSTNGLIILGVAFYGVRFLLITAISSSWGVVFTQSVHCFCSVLFWKGVIVQVKKSYDSKAENQIMLVLYTLHNVLGYTMGTVASGFLYNNYRPIVLFWVMGGVAMTWASVLFLCFFAFNVRLVTKETSFETNLDEEQVSLFSVNSEPEEEPED